MKLSSLSLIFSGILLTGCFAKNFDPLGEYSLKKDGVEYILTIKPNNIYSLETISHEKKRQFSGAWDWEDKDAGKLTLMLSNVDWQSAVPSEGGRGFWFVQLEGWSGNRICLDGEGIQCFEKREGA